MHLAAHLAAIIAVVSTGVEELLLDPTAASPLS
jgi:hypothetical protein